MWRGRRRRQATGGGDWRRSEIAYLLYGGGWRLARSTLAAGSIAATRGLLATEFRRVRVWGSKPRIHSPLSRVVVLPLLLELPDRASWSQERGRSQQGNKGQSAWFSQTISLPCDKGHSRYFLSPATAQSSSRITNVTEVLQIKEKLVDCAIHRKWDCFFAIT